MYFNKFYTKSFINNIGVSIFTKNAVLFTMQ